MPSFDDVLRFGEGRRLKRLEQQAAYITTLEPEFEALSDAGVRMKDDVVAAPPKGPLSGKTIVITGGLASMARSEAEKAAQEAGAHVTSGVSKKTTFVVVGENPGSKHDRALQLGVETIDEREFMKRLKGAQSAR